MADTKKIAWDNSYNLGISMIDTQHKKLFMCVFPAKKNFIGNRVRFLKQASIGKLRF